MGCKYGNADALLEFLTHVRPDYLYIVGDFLDGWRLSRQWYWNDTYSSLLKRLVELMLSGTRVRYTPGNHDEFLRKFIFRLGSVQVADEFIHVTADRKRLLVMHGDQFDSVVRHARWLSHLGDAGYNFLLWLNGAFNAVRRKLGFPYWSLSAFIKRKVKQATTFVDNFETIVTRHAQSKGCHGVVCGHIHTPAIGEHDGVRYYNTGDWVESCTALVEDFDGTLDLIHRPRHYGAPAESPRQPAPERFADPGQFKPALVEREFAFSSDLHDVHDFDARDLLELRN